MMIQKNFKTKKINYKNKRKKLKEIFGITKAKTKKDLTRQNFYLSNITKHKMNNWKWDIAITQKRFWRPH